MTFSGSGLQDLEAILRVFPRDFTIEDVTAYFEWPINRARQAIIAGQQTDVLRLIEDHKLGKSLSGYAVYENTRWRKQWMTKAWRSDSEPELDRQEQGHG